MIPTFGQQNFTKETAPSYGQVLAEIQSYLNQKSPQDAIKLVDAVNQLVNTKNKFPDLTDNSFDGYLNSVYNCYISFARGLANKNENQLETAISSIDRLEKHSQNNVDNRFRLDLLKLFSQLYLARFSDTPSAESFYQNLDNLRNSTPTEDELKRFKDNLSYFAYAGASEFLSKTTILHDKKKINYVVNCVKNYRLEQKEMDNYYKLSYQFIKLAVDLQEKLQFSVCGLVEDKNLTNDIVNLSGELEKALNSIKDPEYKNNLIAELISLKILYRYIEDQPVQNTDVVLAASITNEVVKAQIDALYGFANLMITLSAGTSVNFSGTNDMKFVFWEGLYSFLLYLTTDGKNQNLIQPSLSKFSSVAGNKEIDLNFKTQAKFFESLVNCITNRGFSLNLDMKEELPLLNSTQKNYYYAMIAIQSINSLPTTHIVRQAYDNPDRLPALLPSYVSQITTYFEGLFRTYQGNDTEKVEQAFAFLNLLNMRHQAVYSYLAAYSFISRFSGDNREKMRVMWAYTCFLARNSLGYYPSLATVPDPITDLNDHKMNVANRYYADYLYALIQLYSQRGDPAGQSLAEELCNKVGDIRGCYILATYFAKKGLNAPEKECYNRMITYCEDNEENCDCKIYGGKANQLGGMLNSSLKVTSNFENSNINLMHVGYLFAFSVPIANTGKILVAQNSYKPDFLWNRLPFIGFNSQISLTLNLPVTNTSIILQELPSNKEVINTKVSGLSGKIDLMASQNYILSVIAEGNYYPYSECIRYTQNSIKTIALAGKVTYNPVKSTGSNYGKPIWAAGNDKVSAYLYYQSNNSNQRFLLRIGDREIKLTTDKIIQPLGLLIYNNNVYLGDRISSRFMAFNGKGDEISDDFLLTTLNKSSISEIVSFKQNDSSIYLIGAYGDVVLINKAGLGSSDVELVQKKINNSAIISAALSDNLAYFIEKETGKIYYTIGYNQDPVLFSGYGDAKSSGMICPTDLICDGDGNCYVTDPGANKIFKFNQLGVFIDNFEIADGKNGFHVFKYGEGSNAKLYLATPESVVEYQAQSK